MLGPPRRGAHPQVQWRGRTQVATQARQGVVEKGGPGWPVVLKAGAGGPRGEHQLIGDPGAERRHEHGLSVDGHDPFPLADLVLNEIGEQVSPHRPRGVGAEALPLASDRRRDERHGVELGVRMGQ